MFKYRGSNIKYKELGKNNNYLRARIEYFLAEPLKIHRFSRPIWLNQNGYGCLTRHFTQKITKSPQQKF